MVSIKLVTKMNRREPLKIFFVTPETVDLKKKSRDVSKYSLMGVNLTRIFLKSVKVAWKINKDFKSLSRKAK